MWSVFRVLKRFCRLTENFTFPGFSVCVCVETVTNAYIRTWRVLFYLPVLKVDNVQKQSRYSTEIERLSCKQNFPLKGGRKIISKVRKFSQIHIYIFFVYILERLKVRKFTGQTRFFTLSDHPL